MDSEIKLCDLFQTPRQHSSLALPIGNKGLPRWLSSEESACDAGATGDEGSTPGCVGKILWRRKWQPIPVFLPGESHGQWSLVGYSPWVTESDMTEAI